MIGDASKESNVTHFRLLGIDTGHKMDPLPVLEKDRQGGWRERDDLRVAHNSDVAVVVPIWKVVDLLNRPDLADHRERIGRELEVARGNETAVADMTAARP